MGLAASQARLLTITARKADCEFISMNLSHQKLALARDMEYVSSEYQKALDMTKLVYDYYGTGTSRMDLTYGLLMEPSVYNDYYPKLVTDMTNRVILTSPYAAAARAAGIPAEGLLGTPSSDIRNKFIQALCGNEVITKTMSDAIKSIPYNNGLGLGGGIEVTTGFKEMSYDDLLDKIAACGIDTGTAGLKLGGNKWGPYKDAKDKDDTLYDEVHKNDERLSQVESAASISLYELLTDDIVLVLPTIRGQQTPITAAALLQEELSAGRDSFISWMFDQFTSVLGGVSTNDTALQYAYNCVFDLISPTEDLQKLSEKVKDLGKDQDDETEWGDSYDNFKISDVMNQIGTRVPADNEYGGYNYVGYQANEFVGFIFNAQNKGGDDDGNDHTTVAMDLSNLARVFLTAYVQYMQGLDSSKYDWNVGKLSDCNLYNPKQDDFTFMVAGETEVDTGDSGLYANFYDTLFNRICMSGWTENAKIDDKEYMQEMLKNGMAFISAINDDGFYYQGNYSTDRTILEVKDEDAIAKAQAKYNTEKAKIENKEDTIDMKMKNLDTEISSLTTEYDTVKQLIGKTVEKSFKRYEA